MHIPGYPEAYPGLSHRFREHGATQRDIPKLAELFRAFRTFCKTIGRSATILDISGFVRGVRGSGAPPGKASPLLQLSCIGRFRCLSEGLSWIGLMLIQGALSWILLIHRLSGGVSWIGLIRCLSGGVILDRTYPALSVAYPTGLSLDKPYPCLSVLIQRTILG